MQQRKLGQLGTPVSAVGYGAMSFTDFYGPATEEGSEAILVNWALAREIRSLYPMSLEIAAGADRKSVLQRHRVWRSRASCISSALSRLTVKDFRALLQQLAYSDLVLKGQRQAPGGIWAELERVVLMLCGINVLQRKDAVNY